MILNDRRDVKISKGQTELVQNFINKTQTNGIIKVYGSQSIKRSMKEYNYYVLMEKQVL